jgi:hypothetical protein
MKYYNITKRTEHVMYLAPCDIENLSDAFVTSEQLTEEGMRYQHNVHYDLPKIRAALMEWADCIKDGDICTTKKPRSVVAVFHDIGNRHVLTNCCPQGFSMKGDRIYDNSKKHERAYELRQKECSKEEQRAKVIRDKPYDRVDMLSYTDRGTFTTLISAAILHKFGMRVSFHGHSERTQSFYRRLLSWDDIRKAAKRTLPVKQYRLDIIWQKYLWDNPENLIK